MLHQREVQIWIQTDTSESSVDSRSSYYRQAVYCRRGHSQHSEPGSVPTRVRDSHLTCVDSKHHDARNRSESRADRTMAGPYVNTTSHHPEVPFDSQTHASVP